MEQEQILETQKKRMSRPEGGYRALRVIFRKRRGTKAPAHIIKCGCCNEEVHVYADPESLEINGVEGSLQNWREVLLPLLAIKETEAGFEDTRPLLGLRKKYNPSGEKR